MNFATVTDLVREYYKPNTILFGGPRDGELHLVMGTHLESTELFRGPTHCHAIHYIIHRYEWILLPNGRVQGVYAGWSQPTFPCGATYG